MLYNRNNANNQEHQMIKPPNQLIELARSLE